MYTTEAGLRKYATEVKLVGLGDCHWTVIKDQRKGALDTADLLAKITADEKVYTVQGRLDAKPDTACGLMRMSHAPLIRTRCRRHVSSRALQNPDRIPWVVMQPLEGYWERSSVEPVSDLCAKHKVWHHVEVGPRTSAQLFDLKPSTKELKRK